MTEKTYPSKKDPLVILLLGISILGLILGLFLGLATMSESERLGSIVIGLSASALIVWILLQTNYTLKKEALRVVCGPFRIKIPYDSITNVNPEKTFRSGMALSLDRIVISRKKGQDIIISPENQKTFIKELNKQIERAITS